MILKIGLIFSKRLAKLAKTKLEKKIKKKSQFFFCQRNDFFFLLKQKTLNLKAHGEISQCIWRALYIALNIALRKEEEKIKRRESMGLGEGEVVQQHTDASIAYFSLITCREPFRRNS